MIVSPFYEIKLEIVRRKNMVIELPFVYNTAVITECWTFYRLGIIQTLPQATDWLISHLDLCMDRDYHLFFGDKNGHYRPIYYQDILAAERIDEQRISSKEIVSTLQQEIRNGNYILMDIDTSRHADKVSIHETLFYGFDDEKKVFFVPIMDGGLFKPATISFEDVERIYAYVWQYKRAQYYSSVERMLLFNFPVTRYRPRKDYSIDQSVYEFLNKIHRELDGTVLKGSRLNNAMRCAYPARGYTGIACMVGLQNFIKDIQKNNSSYQPGELSKTIKMLHEHRRLIQLGMLQATNVLKMQQDNVIMESQRDYSMCCEEIQRWYMLAAKMDLTGQLQPLQRIEAKILSVYQREIQALRGFYNECYEHVFKEN
jgi:hypothetical protein